MLIEKIANRTFQFGAWFLTKNVPVTKCRDSETEKGGTYSPTFSSDFGDVSWLGRSTNLQNSTVVSFSGGVVGHADAYTSDVVMPGLDGEAKLLAINPWSILVTRDGALETIDIDDLTTEQRKYLPWRWKQFPT